VATGWHVAMPLGVGRDAASHPSAARPIKLDISETIAGPVPVTFDLGMNRQYVITLFRRSTPDATPPIPCTAPPT
jgi:hypothetical protein